MKLKMRMQRTLKTWAREESKRVKRVTMNNVDLARPLAKRIEYAIERLKAVEGGESHFEQCSIYDFYVVNNYPDLVQEILTYPLYSSFFMELEPYRKKERCKIIGDGLLEGIIETTQNPIEKQRIESTREFWLKDADYIIKPVFCLGEII